MASFTATLHVLGCGGRDSSPSVLLDTDHCKYLFNCGEGTQRLCMEHHVRLSKLQHLFFTEVAADTVGGLPGASSLCLHNLTIAAGMLLTLADSGSNALHLHGPPPLHGFASAMLSFVRREKLRLRVSTFAADRLPAPPVVLADGGTVDFQTEACFSDEVLSAQPLPVLVPSENKEEEEESKAPPHKRARLASWGGVSEECSAINVVNHVEGSGSVGSVCSYLLRLKDRPGRFLPERAKALHVPPGPLFGRLKNGETVTVEGKGGTFHEVHPCDVLAPSARGPVILLACCRDAQTAAALIARKELTKCGEIDVVIHFTPAAVVCSEAYSRWMCEHTANAQHIVVDSSVGQGAAMATRASSRTTLILRQFLPRTFEIVPPPSEEDTRKDAEALHTLSGRLCISVGRTLLRFGLVPASRRRIDSSLCFPPLCPATLLAPLPAQTVATVTHALETLSPPLLTTSTPHPPLTVLGSGSAIPSKHRNVSASLLQCAEGGVLLDCGEGTLWQLQRKFGPGLVAILKDLRVVWLSHLHADHHLGLPSILRACHSAGNSTVVVIGPAQLFPWLRALSRLTNDAFRAVFVPSCALRSREAWTNLLALLHSHGATAVKEMPAFLAVQVDHPGEAHGLLVLHNQWDLVYSGDTRRCLALETAAQTHCTHRPVVLHEATFESSLTSEAHKKQHSTIAQAVASARAMNASEILLSHFSQRYPKELHVEEGSANAVLCCDLLTIHHQEAQWLPHALAAIQPLVQLASGDENTK